MTFGERLTETRKKAGFATRKAFAEKLNIPITTLSNYETDQREAGHKFLKQISNLFNISIDYLLCQTDDPTINGREYDLIEKVKKEYGDTTSNLLKECILLDETDKIKIIGMAQYMQTDDKYTKDKSKKAT